MAHKTIIIEKRLGRMLHTLKKLKCAKCVDCELKDKYHVKLNPVKSLFSSITFFHYRYILMKSFTSINQFSLHTQVCFRVSVCVYDQTSSVHLHRYRMINHLSKKKDPVRPFADAECCVFSKNISLK